MRKHAIEKTRQTHITSYSPPVDLGRDVFKFRPNKPQALEFLRQIAQSSPFRNVVDSLFRETDLFHSFALHYINNRSVVCLGITENPLSGELSAPLESASAFAKKLFAKKDTVPFLNLDPDPLSALSQVERLVHMANDKKIAVLVVMGVANEPTTEAYANLFIENLLRISPKGTSLFVHNSLVPFFIKRAKFVTPICTGHSFTIFERNRLKLDHESIFPVKSSQKKQNYRRR